MESFVPLLLTVVLVGAIYLLMGKLSENEILLSDVVVAKDNLRVNAYITPEEVEQYFEVKQMDASLVTDATVTSLSDLKKRAFYVKARCLQGRSCMCRIRFLRMRPWTSIYPGMR